MNRNMRKMFTEEEIVALAKKHISGGTKLYKHSLICGFKYQGSERKEFQGIIISTNSQPITNANQIANLIDNAIVNNMCIEHREEMIGYQTEYKVLMCMEYSLGTFTSYYLYDMTFIFDTEFDSDIVTPL